MTIFWLIATLVLAGTLALCLKIGKIGGLGGPVERSEQPESYWFGVATTVAFLVFFIFKLISSLVH
jgi:hypothetical protein